MESIDDEDTYGKTLGECQAELYQYFGKHSRPAKFISQEIDKNGEDKVITASKSKLMSALGEIACNRADDVGDIKLYQDNTGD